MELYVGNLIHTMSELELRELFSNHGRVKSAQIITDHFTRQSKCFGYVEMPCDKDALNAVATLDGKEINKQSIIVKEARCRHERRGRPW